MRPFIASVILYFFAGGCTSFVSLPYLPSPSRLLSTSIAGASSGGNGANFGAGDPSIEAAPALDFSYLFCGDKASALTEHELGEKHSLPHAVTVRSHSPIARWKYLTFDKFLDTARERVISHQERDVAYAHSKMVMVIWKYTWH